MSKTAGRASKLAGLFALSLSVAAPAFAASNSFATQFPARILAAHNAVRAQAGVTPLVWDPALGQAAAVVQMRGHRTGGAPLPDPAHCRYFYPQLVRRKNLELEHAKAATLEMLTSQLIILEYDRTGHPEHKGLVLFYRGKGESADEFTYLFDYLRSLQLLKEGVDIEMKLLDASPVAQPMFQKAQQVYIDGLSDASTGSPLAERVKQIQYKRMSQVLTRFSDIELGMDYV